MQSQEILSELAVGLLSGEVSVVDLTAVLGPDTPLIKLPPELAVDTPKVEIHKISEYDKNGPWWAWNWLKLGEHSGTHFDAPIHWISGKDYSDGATDTIPAGKFVGPVNVIDCSKEAAENHDFLLTVDHIKAWETAHGAINPGEWVVMRTDWYKRNGSEAEFLNANETGPHTPGPTAEAIMYLIEKDVRGWGSETIGTDAGLAGGMNPPFPAHTLMHKANKYGLASLCNLDQLPPRGAILIAAPLKIEHGTGSPLRALALVARR
jgi:kynurenine formamidase